MTVTDAPPASPVPSKAVTLLKRYWPPLAHFIGTAVLFLDPSMQRFIVAHKDTGAGIFLVWGLVLSWAESPAKKGTS